MKPNCSIAKAQAAKMLFAASIAALWTAPGSLRADQDSIFERRDDDLITERRDDDLIEPLDPPPAPRPTVQERTEEVFDRSEGRLLDEAMETLDRMERQLDDERMTDTYEAWRERTDRQIDRAMRERAMQERDKPKIYERESDRLAPERREYLESIGRVSDAASAGAADDFRKLEALRESYERDLSQLDDDESRDRRREQYERDRAILLGIEMPPPATAPTTAPASQDQR